MQLVAPDILEQAKGLSILACALSFAFGMFLWCSGWLINRFWIAFFATVSAGLYGLCNGSAYGVQPLIAGLGLALAAGVLAKVLVRLLAYFVGGLAGLLTVHLLFPRWDQPIICVLAGGLLGVLLFRFWVMLFTSAVGGMLMTYSCLCLLDGLGKVDMMTLAKQKTAMLNYVLAGATTGGLLVQLMAERFRRPKGEDGKGAKAAPAPKKSIVQRSLELMKKAV